MGFMMEMQWFRGVCDVCIFGRVLLTHITSERNSILKTRRYSEKKTE